MNPLKIGMSIHRHIKSLFVQYFFIFDVCPKFDVVLGNIKINV